PDASLLLLLLLVLLAPGTVQSSLQKVPLDMAPNAFDDEYQNCTSTTEAKLPALNRSDMARNDIYTKVWANATAVLRKRRPWRLRSRGLTVAQETALMAYTMETPLYKNFNEAVHGAGTSWQCYNNTFHYKTLHFLLTTALQVLRDAQPNHCHRVYRGVSGCQFTAKHNSSIRFGKFTSCSLRLNRARKFGCHTIFSLKTCHGALIRDFSYFPNEEEVLVPPSEVFQVTNVSRNSSTVFIELRSRGLRSNYNCAFLTGEATGQRGAAQ
ncbi:NARE ribosyltransferase, partial [Crypturellus undulatus]|nr:NARE ribosyltransferase [Crypturellus undulatus]